MSGYIAYYRVSTRKQGDSGLGLEAQQAAVASYLRGRKLITSFTEIESGSNNGRPQLAAALKLCRVHRATLVIAKLDRLSRNLCFIAQVLEGDVPITACDMPEADRAWLQMCAVWAEREAKLISERTKVALAAAKVRGVALGGFRGVAITHANGALGRAAQARRAREMASAFAPVIDELRHLGITSTSAIAIALNQRSIPTARGGCWHPASVARLLARI
jgi:DNA invertase Pin-like site-specific DNA recombinase